MSLRRSGLLPLAVAVAVAGCKDVSKTSPPSAVVVATFAGTTLPTPNDLALFAANPGTTTLPAGAQLDLLQSFSTAGGFPSDQAPTLTVPLEAFTYDASTTLYVSAAAPTADPSTVTATTAVLLKLADGAATSIDIEPTAVQAAGALTLVKKADSTGSRRLAAGRYVFAVRGGAKGVKVIGGTALSADQAVALTIPNKDLSNTSNQPSGGLTASQVVLLEQVRSVLWNPLGWSSPAAGSWAPSVDITILPAYQAVDQAFPHAEVASIATFEIAPSAGTVPLVDAASGQVPLPIDLLRTGDRGTIAYNAAFGAAAAGLTTLDGFSTTATLLAPTSFPVDASTVTGANVFLFDLSGPAPTIVTELKANLGAGGDGSTARYVAQPTALNIPEGDAITSTFACPAAGGCAFAIGLQPAVPVPLASPPSFTLPPLKENTSYAVVITNRVTDVLGSPLARPTIMTLLLESNPIAAGGTSLVSGVSDATATALETMRGQLATVFASLPSGTTADDVALAYTFKTQTVTSGALQLAAAPFAIEAGAAQAAFAASSATVVTPPTGTPTTGVAGFYDVAFESVDVIDKATGALRATLASDLADAAKAVTLLTRLHALVAVPVLSCSSPPCAAPLVVFAHGLNGNKDELFAVASSLASAGFVAAAIDLPLHGSRNWCSQDSDCATSDGSAGTCTEFTGAAGQGDTAPPGECTGGSTPVMATSTDTLADVLSTTVASRYFISGNFFRIRDSVRQYDLDVAALGLALARPPEGSWPFQPSTDVFAETLLGLRVAVNPAAVYFEGLSLGAIVGTSAIAVNPRISRAALSVGGGTLVDVFTNSPAFASGVETLFTGLLSDVLGGQAFTFDMVTPGSDTFDLSVAEAYLQTLDVAKWILDPGEPVNYAGHLVATPLPDLLADETGATAQGPKAVYAQIAQGDTVVPNPFNYLLDALTGADVTLYTGASASHAMLLSEGQVQLDAAAFLVHPGSPPLTTRNLP